MAGEPFRNVFEGLDPIFASEVMTAIGMAPEQLRDTRVPALFARAIRFLKDEPNWRLTVSRVLHGKMVSDPLRVLAEYADLRTELESKRRAVSEADEEAAKLSLVADPDGPEVSDARQRRDAAQAEMESVYQEIRIYEK